MLHPQIIVSERDGRLAAELQPLAEAKRWALREPRQADVLHRFLQLGGPTILVIKLGTPPDRELALLERVSWQLPTWTESAVLVGALCRLAAIQNPMLPIYRAREISLVRDRSNSGLHFARRAVHDARTAGGCCGAHWQVSCSG